MRGLFGILAANVVELKTTDISSYTWAELLGGTNSHAGVTVSIDSALRVSTVLACARVLAEGVAQLPLKILRVNKDDAKTAATDNPVYKILARRPNDWMTSFEFREMLMFHAVLTGNGYAYIGRGMGNIVELIPLVPSQVCPRQDADYNLTYEVTDRHGHIATLPRESVMHIRGPAWNGYLGMDAVQLAREAIGLAIVTEEAQSNLHKNGARPGGVLSVKGKLDNDAKARLKASWEAAQSTVRNAFKTAVLDVDADWKPMGMTGVDSQHLETRRFQIEEVCRAMRVFPQMVMHTDKTSTFASAEQFFLAHVTHSLMPWITRWEHTIERDLLDNAADLIAKFNLSALLRGDAVQRSTFYEKALGGARGETAYMTRNEVRALEDLDPIEGGDVLPTPLAPAMGPAQPIEGPDINVDPALKTQIDYEKKMGRVLSSRNESRIRNAKDELDTVLSSLPQGDA